jgi:hypothetical protein
MNDNKETFQAVMIDPPSGWRYGFPKQAPATLREMTAWDLNEWLVKNGYPQEEIDVWVDSGKYDGPPCRFFIAEGKAD